MTATCIFGLVFVLAAVAPAVGAQGSPARAAADSADAILVARADSLDRLDPGRELDSAWAHGDRRPVGYVGYMLVIPAMSDRREAPDVDYDPAHVHIIDGTSDCICSAGIRRLNAAASAYAARYNTLLRRRLDEERARPAP